MLNLFIVFNLFPIIFGASTFDKKGWLIGEKMNETKDEENKPNERLMVMGAENNYVCFKDDCFPLVQYTVSLKNTFDCNVDTILIDFERLKDNITYKTNGYLLPYSRGTRISDSQKYSDICHIIKR